MEEKFVLLSFTILEPLKELFFNILDALIQYEKRGSVTELAKRMIV
jgi:hypothetical protein